MATWYANQAGSGAADGTSAANAWSIAGIDWTASGVEPGDTLVLAADITSEVVMGDDGTAADPIIISGGTIAGGGVAVSAIDNEDGGRDYITLDGITAGGTTGSVFDLGQSTANPLGVKALNCVINGAGTTGINTTGVAFVVDSLVSDGAALTDDILIASAGTAGTTSGAVRGCYLKTQTGAVDSDAFQVASGANGAFHISKSTMWNMDTNKQAAVVSDVTGTVTFSQCHFRRDGVVNGSIVLRTAGAGTTGTVNVIASTIESPDVSECLRDAAASGAAGTQQIIGCFAANTGGNTVNFIGEHSYIFHQCVLYNSGSTATQDRGLFLNNDTETQTSWTMRNNIVRCGWLVYEIEKEPTTIVMDYNCYFGGGTFRYDQGFGGDAYATLALLQAGHAGIEQNSLASDPLFRDEANNDFRLKDNSPCIGAGTIWTNTAQNGADGRLFAMPPSMGAYEYYGGGAIPARVIPAGVDLAGVDLA